MLPILLALAAQTATLDSDTKKAAMTCATTVAPAQAPLPPLRRAAQVSHYVMQAARADRQGKPFLDRVQALMEESTATPPPTAAAATALLPKCDQRFPRARGTQPARLPGDPFKRDVMCFATLAILQGAAEQVSDSTGDGAPLARVKAAFALFMPRLGDDVLKQHGIDSDEKFKAALGDHLDASLDLGNLETVALSCGMAA